MTTASGKPRRSFRVFRRRFLDIIPRRNFGEPSHYGDKNSPGSVELRKTGLISLLDDQRFLRTIYRLASEKTRLENEQPKVRAIAKQIRPSMIRTRNATKRLRSVNRGLKQFLSDYGALVEPKVVNYLTAAIEYVVEVDAALTQRQKIMVARVHVKLRKGADEPYGWDPLLKGYEYDLETLKVKAADQWFWGEANSNLLGFFQRHRIRRVTEMLRVRLISALCEAAGIGHFPPTTIKEYLLHQRK